MTKQQKAAAHRTVLLVTLGCKVAQYETEAIRESFLAAGYREAESDADVVIANTCTVTAESDRKCRQAIRRLARENPRARILIFGCYAQSHPAEAAAISGVSFVGGTAGKMRALAVAERLLIEPPHPAEIAVRPLDGEVYEAMCVSGAPRTRAYVKIADGCDCRCTYCAIPEARGPVRSRLREEILEETLRLAEGGVREVVLTGIETASYGRDRHDGYRLIDLLEEVDRLPIDRIRLGSLTPEILHGDFASRAAQLRHLAPHFHLSVQSGSDRVLAAMKRRYNRRMMLEGIEALRAAFPDLQLTADVIVGFPGESKEDFALSMDLAEKARFLSMHVFAFSPRKGTVAYSLPGAIPEDEKAERSRELIALSERLTRENLAAVLAEGKPLTVLFETERDGVFTGHTPSFLEVSAPAARDLRGGIHRVIPTAIFGARLMGTVIEEIKNTDI